VSRAGLSYFAPRDGIVLTKSGLLAWTSLPSRATNAPSTSGSGTIVRSPPVLDRICSGLTVWMTLNSRLQVSPEPNNRQEATSHPQCRPHGSQLRRPAGPARHGRGRRQHLVDRVQRAAARRTSARRVWWFWCVPFLDFRGPGGGTERLSLLDLSQRATSSRFRDRPWCSL
jgi:hypothetical protein